MYVILTGVSNQYIVFSTAKFCVVIFTVHNTSIVWSSVQYIPIVVLISTPTSVSTTGIFLSRSDLVALQQTSAPAEQQTTRDDLYTPRSCPRNNYLHSSWPCPAYQQKTTEIWPVLSCIIFMQLSLMFLYLWTTTSNIQIIRIKCPNNILSGLETQDQCHFELLQPTSHICTLFGAFCNTQGSYSNLTVFQTFTKQNYFYF